MGGRGRTPREAQQGIESACKARVCMISKSLSSQAARGGARECSGAHHGQQVVLVDALGRLHQTPLLDDQRVQPQLLVRLLNHLQRRPTHKGEERRASSSSRFVSTSEPPRRHPRSATASYRQNAATWTHRQRQLPQNRPSNSAPPPPTHTTTTAHSCTHSHTHLLLDGTFGAQTEHLHLLLLADAVRTVHGLQVHLRVPVCSDGDKRGQGGGSRGEGGQQCRGRSAPLIRCSTFPSSHSSFS